MKNILKDFSISTVVAGAVAVLVGYASSAVIVYEAALASGATPIQASSWLGILCVSMGALTVILSLKYKIPVMFAWSTAGGALLISSVQGIPITETIGAFVFSASLVLICGVTGFFERVMNKIPVALASAMLAGVLLHFALDVFVAMKSQMTLGMVMFVVYILGRRYFPRYNIVIVLISGMMIAWLKDLFHFRPMDFSILNPVYVHPTFNIATIISVGIPLFVVTMSSQNLTGVAVMKTFGYRPKVSELISWSGLVNLAIAPFGGYTLNLSAITAAICMGPEAHPDVNKRYTAAVSSGLIYIVIGIFSGAMVGIFEAFPKELILMIAGLALMGTVSSGLEIIFDHKDDREAAMITFFVTASGVTLLGVGAAFWGLVAGSVVTLIFRFRKEEIRKFS
jgi:benzoate membrane transport protein